jgi:plasmid stability protein
MTITLTVKKVPVALARELRRRAALHHRSLQGELLRMLEAAASGEPAGLRDPAGVREPRDGRLTLEQAWARSRRIMAQASAHPPEGESAQIVRRDRDAREARGR